MKKIYSSIVLLIALVTLSSSSCEKQVAVMTADQVQQQQTARNMKEASRAVGMPAVSNFTEMKQLKWIYELCDQENLICHAYLANEYKGTVGQYLGKCIGYGTPYSTQYSNPERVANMRGDYGQYANDAVYTLAQPEPNGLFKPEGLSATWVVLLHPKTGEPCPVYIEATIIVSPFKLH